MGVKAVTPWNDSGFVGTEDQKKMVYASLKRAGIPVGKWKEKPGEKVLNGLREILPGIFENEWQIICINRADVMQAIAEICPIIFSLTTKEHLASVMVTTDKVIHRIEADEDAVEFGTMFDVLRLVRTAGLMCWLDAGQPHEAGKKYHYKFAELLMSRKSKENATVFLVSYSIPFGKKFDNEESETVFSKLEQALGTTAALLIKQASSMLVLNISGDNTPARVKEI